MEELQNKKLKLQEIQERIKASAMNHKIVDEETEENQVTAFQMADPIEVDLGSDEEDLSNHQPVPCFGRTKSSPTRQAETPMGGVQKKVKQEAGTASK